MEPLYVTPCRWYSSAMCIFAPRSLHLSFARFVKKSDCEVLFALTTRTGQVQSSEEHRKVSRTRPTMLKYVIRCHNTYTRLCNSRCSPDVCNQPYVPLLRSFIHSNNQVHPFESRSALPQADRLSLPSSGWNDSIRLGTPSTLTYLPPAIFKFPFFVAGKGVHNV